jgi:hypothetical protein
MHHAPPLLKKLFSQSLVKQCQSGKQALQIFMQPGVENLL